MDLEDGELTVDIDGIYRRKYKEKACLQLLWNSTLSVHRLKAQALLKEGNKATVFEVPAGIDVKEFRGRAFCALTYLEPKENLYEPRDLWKRIDKSRPGQQRQHSSRPALPLKKAVTPVKYIQPKKPSVPPKDDGTVRPKVGQKPCPPLKKVIPKKDGPTQRKEAPKSSGSRTKGNQLIHPPSWPVVRVPVPSQRQVDTPAVQKGEHSKGVRKASKSKILPTGPPLFMKEECHYIPTQAPPATLKSKVPVKVKTEDMPRNAPSTLENSTRSSSIKIPTSTGNWTPPQSISAPTSPGNLTPSTRAPASPGNWTPPPSTSVPTSPGNWTPPPSASDPTSPGNLSPSLATSASASPGNVSLPRPTSCVSAPGFVTPCRYKGEGVASSSSSSSSSGSGSSSSSSSGSGSSSGSSSGSGSSSSSSSGSGSSSSSGSGSGSSSSSSSSSSPGSTQSSPENKGPGTNTSPAPAPPPTPGRTRSPSPFPLSLLPRPPTPTPRSFGSFGLFDGFDEDRPSFYRFDVDGFGWGRMETGPAGPLSIISAPRTPRRADDSDGEGAPPTRKMIKYAYTMTYGSRSLQHSEF